MIDLQRFCESTLGERPYLQAPWRVGQWVYAANGHVAVRVDAGQFPSATDETPKHPKTVEGLFRKWFDDATGQFVPMPAVPHAPACEACKGRGRSRTIECDECVDGEFDHGSHTYDCKECDGDGYIATDAPDIPLSPCRACYGLGFGRSEGAKIGDVVLERGYLHWFDGLQNVRIRTNGPDDPVAILFDGGQALLMPMRA